jgi:MFS family permease
MRILTHHVVASSCAVATFLIIGINVQTTYLPFWLQASRGFNAQKSGLLILPLAASNPISALVAGAIASRTGHYIPLILSSGAITAVGYGLLSTLDTSSSMAQIIGYQLVAGIGFGFGVQLPLTAMRHALPDDDMPIANSLLIFFQSLGNSLSQSGGQAVFLGAFTAALGAELPPTEVQHISELGAGNIDAQHVGQDLLPIVIEAYGLGMRHASYLTAASSCAAFVCSWGMISRDKGGNKENNA